MEWLALGAERVLGPGKGAVPGKGLLRTEWGVLGRELLELEREAIG